MRCSALNQDGPLMIFFIYFLLLLFVSIFRVRNLHINTYIPTQQLKAKSKDESYKVGLVKLDVAGS